MATNETNPSGVGKNSTRSLEKQRGEILREYTRNPDSIVHETMLAIINERIAQRYGVLVGPKNQELIDALLRNDQY